MLVEEQGTYSLFFSHSKAPQLFVSSPEPGRLSLQTRRRALEPGPAGGGTAAVAWGAFPGPHPVSSSGSHLPFSLCSLSLSLPLSCSAVTVTQPEPQSLSSQDTQDARASMPGITFSGGRVGGQAKERPAPKSRLLWQAGPLGQKNSGWLWRRPGQNSPLTPGFWLLSQGRVGWGYRLWV